MTRPADIPEAVLDAVLDADTLALLDEAITPEPIDAQMQARIKSRLLQRVAADCTAQHVTVRPQDKAWKQLAGGLSLKVLHRDEGVMSYLLRMAPGSKLPAHRHPIDEECVVLEGAVQIGALHVAAGGFHLGRKNVLHEVIESADGALLFLRGAVPEEALSL
jgi:anti-sigma factor ChrR (cupin superfamily)